MDLSKTLEHNFTVNILCLRVGNSDPKTFDRIIELLRKKSSKITLLPFWQNDIKEPTKITLPNRVIITSLFFSASIGNRTNILYRIGMKITLFATISLHHSKMIGLNFKLLCNDSEVTFFLYSSNTSKTLCCIFFYDCELNNAEKFQEDFNKFKKVQSLCPLFVVFTSNIEIRC